MAIDGVGGVSGPNGPDGLNGPQRPDGPRGPEGVEGRGGPEGPGGSYELGGADRIEKVPELAPLFEKIHALPPQEPPSTGEIAALNPDDWGPEDEQRIHQIIDRILEEGI